MPTTLRIGVLGTGRITRKLGPAIARTPGAALAAVGSRDGDRAAAWAGEFGAPRSHGSYAALIADPDLDAVYIALPPALHREWTVKAADRGLHVLCEKPLGVTAADAVAMAGACRAAGVQLMDGTMWVHTPRAAAMREVLRSGSLGNLRRVTAAFTFHPDQWGDDEHRLSPALGGGCLVDEGWYCVGAALWAFGETPAWAFGTAETAGGGADVAFTAVLGFSGGRTVGFDCGYRTAMRRWLEVAGTDGSLVCDDFTRPASPEKTRFWTHGRWGASTETRCEPCDQESALIAAFVTAVRTGPDPAWADAAVTVQRVCDALRQSAAEGRPVEISPAW